MYPYPLFFQNKKRVHYLLRDDFNGTVAAGSVNGTNANPGPGVRTVVDTTSLLSVGSGGVSYTPKGTPAIGDPGIWLPAATKSAGRMFITSVLPAGAVSRHYVAFHQAQSATALTTGFGLVFNIGGVINTVQQGVNASVDAYTATRYYITCIMRASSGVIFIKGGAFTNWTLLGIYPAVGIAATLYPVVMSGNNGTGALSCDYMRVPDELWLPSPLASDSFATAFGTTNGLGHPETSGVGSGGSGLTWTQIGTWGISGAKANCSALSGGLGIAHVATSTPDVIASVEIVRTAGAAGLVLRYTDANNYLYAYHDGTNAALIEVVAGTPANVIAPAAATYSAGKTLQVRLSGSSAEMYYNSTRVGTGGATNILTGNNHGIWTNDTTPTLDNYQLYARGTSAEYSYLNRFLA